MVILGLYLLYCFGNACMMYAFLQRTFILSANSCIGTNSVFSLLFSIFGPAATIIILMDVMFAFKGFKIPFTRVTGSEWDKYVKPDQAYSSLRPKD